MDDWAVNICTHGNFHHAFLPAAVRWSCVEGLGLPKNPTYWIPSLSRWLSVKMTMCVWGNLPENVQFEELKYSLNVHSDTYCSFNVQTSKLHMWLLVLFSCLPPSRGSIWWCKDKIFLWEKKKNQDQNSFAWQNSPPTQKHVPPSQEFWRAWARPDISNTWHLTPSKRVETVKRKERGGKLISQILL